MPVKGLEAAKSATDKIVGNIRGPLSLKTVTEICIIGAGYASTMTPVDTSVLINSQYRDVRETEKGVTGRVGYTAEYAAAVHDAKGTLLGQYEPRDKADPSRGNYWDPIGAEPKFLLLGFETANGPRPEILAAIKRGMAI